MPQVLYMPLFNPPAHHSPRHIWVSLFNFLPLFPLFGLLLECCCRPVFLPSRRLAVSTTLQTPAVIAPVPSLPPSSFTTVCLLPRCRHCMMPFRIWCPCFHVSFGCPPILPKLVDQIHNGGYMELRELLPDSLRDNEVPQDLLLESWYLVTPKCLP